MNTENKCVRKVILMMLIIVIIIQRVGAQNKKSSSECKSMGSDCNPNEKDCCNGLACGLTTKDPNSWKCVNKTCQELDELCGLGFDSCCSGYQCSNERGVVRDLNGRCELKGEKKKKCKVNGEACFPIVQHDCCPGNICSSSNTTDPNSWKCVKGKRCAEAHDECGIFKPPCCNGYECVSSKCTLKGQESSSVCKSMGGRCNPNDNDCCNGLACGPTNYPDILKCQTKTCQRLDELCGLGFDSCCFGYQCTNVGGSVSKCQLKKEEPKMESGQNCLAKGRACVEGECCSGLRCAKTRWDFDFWNCIESSCIERLQPCGLLHPCCEGLECEYKGTFGGLTFKGECVIVKNK